MKKTFGKYAVILILLLTGLGADYCTKQWALHQLKNKPVVSAIRGFLELGFVENRGMVFGILNRGDNPHGVLSVVTWVRVAVCIFVSAYIVMKRRMPLLFLLPMCLIWLGAVGNLIDIFRRGYVIDFIHIHAANVLDWPFFFNIADAYVCIGAGMLLMSGFFSKHPPK
jgi:signal peptidase II